MKLGKVLYILRLVKEVNKAQADNIIYLLKDYKSIKAHIVNNSYLEIYCKSFEKHLILIKIID